MLRFGEWQESKGIKPWLFQPNHIETTFNSIETFFNQATNAIIVVGEAMKKFSVSFLAFSDQLNKED